ncbi:MAG TPA: VOC family protein [Acidimicrobiales bacterium]|nr:VOC family protein [Acidimicrobiales bacterium]
MTAAAASVPVLPVADLVRAVAWYERLGFRVRAFFDGYAILGLDGAELHLNELPGLPPATESVSGAYLRVADADAVFAVWTAMGAPTVAPPEDQPYGIREFATEDLDGNLWRIGAVIPGGPADGYLPPDAPAVEAAPAPAVPADALDSAAGAPATPAPPEQEVPSGPAPDAAGSRTDGGAGTGQESWPGIVADGRRCAGCGLVNGELAARAIGAQVRDEVHALGELLAAAGDDAVRQRPAPVTWSALEYGVHVRDLLSVFAERIIRTLAEHDPQLGWWDHEAAIEDGFANESDVSAVVDDLGRNAAKLSEALRLVSDDDWDRPATRRAGERMTIEVQARFALHEVVHHRADAVASLAAAGAS